MGAVKRHIHDWVDKHVVEGEDGWYVATTDNLADGPFEGPFNNIQSAEEHAWKLAHDEGLAFTLPT